jgi:hypothetical protein
MDRATDWQMGNGGEGEKWTQPAERRLVKDITVDKKDL